MSRVSITVSDADALLRGLVRPVPEESVPLWEAAGRILREPVKADAAYPPFDRVCMDGFALRADAGNRSEFHVDGFVPAGHSPIPLIRPEGCIEVMTGAALPQGTDCIVPVEDIIRTGDIIKLKSGTFLKTGQHIHSAGKDYRAGDILLEPGLRLNGPHLAVAAAVGQTQLRVSKRPAFHLLLTGDELVPVGKKPGGVQIRMTHPYALQGLIKPWADLTFEQVRDDAGEIGRAIQSALKKCDVLLLTGGVSAGRHDWVPEALGSLGAKTLFHKVKQRPGNPLWVGESAEGKPIFAFPGNPVAACVCARRYLLPWMWRCLGMDEPVPLNLPLAEAQKGLEDKVLFSPVTRRNAADGSWEAHASRIQGSGDFGGLAASHGFVEITAGRNRVEAGEKVPYFDWSFA